MNVRDIAGRNLRRLRLDRGLSQERLSEASGYPQQLISELETGKGNPTIDTLAQLSAALGVEAWELLKP